MSWVLSRLREASTWRGIVWLLTVAGVSSRPDEVEAIILAGMALAGLLGVFLQDKSRNPQERTRETDLPEIELQGRSNETTQPDSFNNSISISCNESIVRLCEDRVSSDDGTQSPESVVRSDSNGYNG